MLRSFLFSATRLTRRSANPRLVDLVVNFNQAQKRPALRRSNNPSFVVRHEVRWLNISEMLRLRTAKFYADLSLMQSGMSLQIYHEQNLSKVFELSSPRFA